jgi:outer membrane receptor for Fe3+-dicitrate
VLAPNEKIELRTGLRFDNHEAPFAGSQNQLSPRIKLSFFPNPATTLYAYYGRLFVPTNVEDLRAITSVAQADTVTVPTLPERDHFFELGLVHRFPYGVVAKLSAYHKRSSPGIDDNTVPGSAIVTSVDINQVRVTGIESVLEIRPGGRFSGYVNLALAHAYGHGPVTGGFFPTDNPEGYFDLDHDQRLSGLATINYADSHLFASVTGTYGSGLTNGADPDSTFGRGLFAFNQSIKVSPSFITDASAGYLLNLGTVLVRPEIYVSNVFNHAYLLKRAFFSGAAVGRPRSVLVRLNFGV